MEPRVGIVIPVYNTGHYLEEAIESVLAQTEPVEIVVVDDASTDPVTLAILESYSQHPAIRLVRHERNAGIPAGLNSGIAELATPYVFAVGSDDIVEPTYAQQAADILDADEDVAIVTTPIQHFGAESHIDTASGAPNGLVDLLFQNTVPGISVHRRSAWESVGGYRQLSWSEDWDFWIRVLSLGGRCEVLPAPAYRWRIHASQTTSTRPWETKLEQQVAMVRDNPQPWIEHIDLVMEQLWQTQVDLNYFKKRYGRFNAVKKSTIDSILAARARWIPRTRP